MKLWGGRFTKEENQLVHNFNESLSFDQKFYHQDIQGSMAHVKMLAKHTAETLLEVLMFALARQMVVVHETMIDTLIGIVALGAIFAIRKYLLLKTPDKQKIYDKL